MIDNFVIDQTLILLLLIISFVLSLMGVFLGIIIYMTHKLNNNPEIDVTEKENKRI